MRSAAKWTIGTVFVLLLAGLGAFAAYNAPIHYWETSVDKLYLVINGVNYTGKIEFRGYGLIGHKYLAEVSIDIWSEDLSKHIAVNKIAPGYLMEGVDDGGRRWGPYKVLGYLRTNASLDLLNPGPNAPRRIGKNSWWNQTGDGITFNSNDHEYTISEIGSNLFFTEFLYGVVFPSLLGFLCGVFTGLFCLWVVGFLRVEIGNGIGFGRRNLRVSLILFFGFLTAFIVQNKNMPSWSNIQAKIRVYLDGQVYIGMIDCRMFGPPGHRYLNDVSINMWTRGFTKRIEINEIAVKFMMSGVDRKGSPWGPYRILGGKESFSGVNFSLPRMPIRIGQVVWWNPAGDALILKSREQIYEISAIGRNYSYSELFLGTVVPPYVGFICGIILGAIVLWVIQRFNLPANMTLCPRCGYDLHGSGGRDAGCPECGWNRPESEGYVADKDNQIE